MTCSPIYKEVCYCHAEFGPLYAHAHSAELSERHLLSPGYVLLMVSALLVVAGALKLAYTGIFSPERMEFRLVSLVISIAAGAAFSLVLTLVTLLLLGTMHHPRSLRPRTIQVFNGLFSVALFFLIYALM